MRVSHVALALGLAGSVSSSFSHVVLADQAALAGTSYRATLRVGHGCDGSPVTTLRVTIPNGFTGAKPMPKAGWVLTTQVGKQVSEGLLEVTWLEIIESSPVGHQH